MGRYGVEGRDHSDRGGGNGDTDDVGRGFVLHRESKFQLPVISWFISFQKKVRLKKPFQSQMIFFSCVCS